MKALILAALVMALANRATQADTPEGPPIIVTKDKVAATMKANPVGGIVRLGRQAIVLEDTDLSKLAERADADIGHRGQGERRLDWICLTDTAAQTRLWIISNAVSVGAVDGLTLAYLPHVQATDNCPEIPADWRRIVLPGGLELGMTGESLKAKVGTPSYDKEGLVGFSYAKPIMGGGVRASSVWAAVDNGKVGLLGLTQFTS